MRRRSPHDDLGADGDATVEVDDVLVEKADAARGDVATDGAGLVGAVDAVERVAPTFIEIKCTGTQGIELAAVDTIGNKLVVGRGAVAHLPRGIPGWPFGAPCDMGGARPGKTLPSDPHGITNGLAAGQHEIERMAL